MKIIGFLLNIILAIIMVLICIACVFDYVNEGAFGTFIESFAVLIFASINIWGICDND